MTTTKIPAWQGTHAYLAGAVVSTTTGLPLYRCTTAGTSGVAEPTWPTADPWTVTDGTVIWTLNTTFRSDVYAAAQTLMSTFRAANPTLVRKVWPARPDSFTLGDLPCVVLGNFTERINTTQGVRQRMMDGFTVEVVDRAPLANEAALRMTGLVDAILDYLTANYHAASGTSIVEPIGVTDGDTGAIGEGTNLFWFSNLIMFRAYVSEGRV